MRGKRFGALGLSRYDAGLFAMTVCVFGGICALWLSGRHETYFWLMGALGAPAWKRPFLDLAGVFSWAQCHRLGFDVFKTNPCDPLNRPLNYGPVLLDLPFGVRDTNWLGAMQDLAFIAILPFVLRPRSPGQLVVATGAAISSTVLYALERANIDVFEFVLIALTAPLMARGRIARGFSYAMYFLGGATKFYPFALLLLVLRERPKIAAALGFASLLAMGAYAMHYWPQLKAIASLLPPFQDDSDVFGAYILPLDSADFLDLPPMYALPFVLLFMAGFGALAWRLAGRLRNALAADDWKNPRLFFLLVGAIVTVGCFFTQTNIDYRGIFLLFALPGFFELRERTRPLEKIFTIAVAVLLFCLWSDFFRLGIDNAMNAFAPGHPDAMPWNLPANFFIVMRELAWWWLISVLASVIVAFVLSSPGFVRLERMLGSRGAA
jgi:hypothetical protein